MQDQTATWRTALGIAILAVVYTGLAKLGLGLDAVSGFATLVWPPTGLATASLLLFGSRLWPGVFLGAWIVNVWVGAPIGTALGIGIGNTLEAVLGAYALRHFAGYRRTLDSLRLVLVLLGASALSTLVSATFGVASLALAGIVHSAHQAIETWRAWWVGDVLGDLVVAPLLLTWARAGERGTPRAGRVAEALALGTLLGLASYSVFFRPRYPIYPFESPYVLFPLFMWAALRFELRGATLATAVASVFAVWGTAHGSGPFYREVLSSGLLALQTFMGCAALTSLVVAGVTMDRARAIQAQEVFVATVSHDLKNPLNALLMSGDSLLRRLPDELVQKHHQVLRRSVDRMMRLITDLLDASAIEHGHLAVEGTLENMGALIGDAVDLLRPLAATKSVQITLDVPSGEPAQVLCDRDRVLQVLSNLIGNAIKFSPERSTIAVKEEHTERAVRVSIRDGGPGIEGPELSRVFERHWHAKPSAGGGTGLGLFIAKGIVEAHDGTIGVKSAIGAGSTFFFELPIRQERRTLVERIRHSYPHA